MHGLTRPSVNSSAKKGKKVGPWVVDGISFFEMFKVSHIQFSRFGRFCISSRVKWFSAEAGKVNLVGDTRNATSKEAIRPCTNDGDGSNA